jgi:hypothetical protein
MSHLSWFYYELKIGEDYTNEFPPSAFNTCFLGSYILLRASSRMLYTPPPPVTDFVRETEIQAHIKRKAQVYRSVLRVATFSVTIR